MDGLDFLADIPPASVPVAFFDPQYRGVLDKLQYGNEGKSRGRGRSALKQMDAAQISTFIQAINRVLAPSGHLFLWVDKFHLCTGISDWLTDTELATVDLITWAKLGKNGKLKIGMGYRTRRTCEYLLILQKAPQRAKGVWKSHKIPDVFLTESPSTDPPRNHPHAKPVDLQAALIEAVSEAGDVVIDPAAGSFSVLTACEQTGRNFLGCDIV